VPDLKKRKYRKTVNGFVYKKLFNQTINVELLVYKDNVLESFVS